MKTKKVMTAAEWLDSTHDWDHEKGECADYVNLKPKDMEDYAAYCVRCAIEEAAQMCEYRQTAPRPLDEIARAIRNLIPKEK